MNYVVSVYDAVKSTVSSYTYANAYHKKSQSKTTLRDFVDGLGCRRETRQVRDGTYVNLGIAMARLDLNDAAPAGGINGLPAPIRFKTRCRLAAFTCARPRSSTGLLKFNPRSS